MSNERVILCGGVSPSNISERHAIHLRPWGRHANVNLKISDISKTMVANIPPILEDLLEVATYVYCADQATTRGGNGVINYGAKWRRHFRFHIPVRQPAIWSSKALKNLLCDTLWFLSDDEYEFVFEKLEDPPPISRYLEYSTNEAQVDEVILFSGGIDSLAGAVQEAIVGKKKIALVSHRAAPKIAKHQKSVLHELTKYCPSPPLHVPVWINKDKELGVEHTQRTRSFLYASMAAVVARLFDLWRIRFYENGVMSINLPISPQLVGSRASRTTHPQVISGLTDFFTALFEKAFVVENPFLWMTRGEVVRFVRDKGVGNLIKHTVSCSHVRQMLADVTHCGVCSQCVGRRFATLAAGCSDQEDPSSIYAVDLFKGAREKVEDRTLLESFIRRARQVKDISDTAFFTEFGEANRVTKYVKGVAVDEVGSRIYDLYRRHAKEVCDVIDEGIRSHTRDITNSKLDPSSLLIIAIPEKYKQPKVDDEEKVQPLLVLDEITDGETNRGLLARIVGHGRFDGVNKKIGARQFLFTYLLFKSTRAFDVGGEQITVVTEDEVVKKLLAWSQDGYLRLTGKDVSKPAHRVQKMWLEFVRQMEKETNLKNLFASEHKEKGSRLYGLRLRPSEKQILVHSVEALLKKNVV